MIRFSAMDTLQFQVFAVTLASVLNLGYLTLLQELHICPNSGNKLSGNWLSEFLEFHGKDMFGRRKQLPWVFIESHFTPY